MIEAACVGDVPELGRIVVAVDPPASSRQAPRTPAASSRPGWTATGRRVVLADATVRAAQPQDWAGAAVALFHRLQADCLVAEVNQGGDMVTAVIRTVDPAVPVQAVRATPRQVDCAPSRWRRSTSRAGCATPARFPALEDEMCDFGAERAFRRPLARPRRRAGLGDERADAGRHGRAEDQGL